MSPCNEATLIRSLPHLPTSAPDRRALRVVVVVALSNVSASDEGYATRILFLYSLFPLKSKARLTFHTPRHMRCTPPGIESELSRQATGFYIVPCSKLLSARGHFKKARKPPITRVAKYNYLLSLPKTSLAIIPISIKLQIPV